MAAIVEVAIAISLKSLLVCKVSMELIISIITSSLDHKDYVTYLHQLLVLGRRARAVVVQHLS